MKHAILIGLNQTVGLAPLANAVESAKKMKDWADDQGFITHLFVDDIDKIIKAGDIVDLLEELVKEFPEQLLIYFSGHGCIRTAGSELWLMSKALTRGEEAFDLYSSKANAYESGIKNVVFISDACRTPATELNLTMAAGRSIFPTLSNRDPETKIDMLYASWPGSPAHEVKQKDGSFSAVYSECLLECLNGEVNEVIQHVPQLKPGIFAVLPYELNEYLTKAVPDRIIKNRSFFKQQPMGEVTSRQPIYISEIKDFKSRFPEVFDNATIKHGEYKNTHREIYGKDRDSEYERKLKEKDIDSKLKELIKLTKNEALENQVLSDKIALARNTKDFYRALYRNEGNYYEGFVINGTGTYTIYSQEDDYSLESYNYVINGQNLIYTSIKNTKDWKPKISLMLLAQHKESGIGFPIAIVPGFICQINFNDNRLKSVDYFPINDIRQDQLMGELNKVAERKAVIISAAKQGIFQASTEAGTYLRRFKHLDPTLGLFAAYAYAQNGDFEDVVSVYDYVMRDDRTALFDVDLLKKVALQTKDENEVLGMKIPLLTQGFSYLSKVYNDKNLRNVVSMLNSGLWTTFKPEGVSFLIKLYNLKTI